MARVAVLGITGRVGSRVGAELLRRKHLVSGFARSVSGVTSTPGLTLAALDGSDADQLAARLRGHDAFVSATRFVNGIGARELIAAANKSGVMRVLVVGGAGSLRSAPGGQALLDTPGFPPAYRAEALAGRAFLEVLRGEQVLEWTFLSPSAQFAPGVRSGCFRLGGDELLVDGQGHSRISMEDFAVALVDEIEHPTHVRQRFTVGY